MQIEGEKRKKEQGVIRPQQVPSGESQGSSNKICRDRKENRQGEREREREKQNHNENVGYQ